MSDKPKTFEEWSKSKQNPAHLKRLDSYYTLEHVISIQQPAWNARDELAKEELAKMQAEIDKRNKLILEVVTLIKTEWPGVYGAEIIKFYNDRLEKYEKLIREITQGSKDE